MIGLPSEIGHLVVVHAMDETKKKLRFELKLVSGLAREGCYVRAVWREGPKKGSLASAEKVLQRITQLLTDAGYMTQAWEK